MKSHTIKMAVLVFVFIAGAVMLTPQTYAQTPTPTQHQNFFQELVTFIAQKFGLDKTQVQQAVQDFHNQRKAQMQQNRQKREDDRLNKLVTDGKITTAQKTAIENELTALRAKYNPDNLKYKTPEERKEEFKAEQDELTNWAKTNNIDPTLLTIGVGPGVMMRRGMPGKGDWDK